MDKRKKKSKKVKVDIQCPFCGHCEFGKTHDHRRILFCPGCRQKLFLSFAVDYRGQLDKNGCYFHAYEPFKASELNKEYEQLFNEVSS